MQRIEVFLLQEFNTKERTIKRIKVHREHNLIMKNHLPTKENDSFMLMVYIKCLTCNKKIWKHSIQGKKNYLSSISNKIINFQNDIQQNEKMLKEYQDKELERSIVDENKKALEKSISIYKLEVNLENLDLDKNKKFRRKGKKTNYQKIIGLKNKYRENVEHIEDKGHFLRKPEKVIWCGICKSLDFKGFCDIYDCYPLNYKIPAEEYCNKFLLDNIKAEESKKRNKLTM